MSPSLSYTVRNAFCPPSRIHPLRSSHRPSSLLTNRLSCGTVQREQGPDSETVQDYGARCNVLFPDNIHFASRDHAVYLIRKCKDIVVILCHLSTARLDLYSLESNYFLPGG
jgi:hypothetical protein